MLAIMSIISISNYRKKDANVDYDTLVSSPLSPGVSVIAPAFNESLTIIFNVRSLLTFNYPKFEVIIVNDGSTDDTLQKMINEFELTEVDFAYNPKLQTRPVQRIFKSTNKAYNSLMVIDKENGKSKADAVNAGINAAAFDYFVCSDVDCILDKDTILKLIKPVLDEEKYRVIATGATLRMANSCDIDKGVITRVRPPRQWLARFQEMEYIRAFILGKMGWNYVNCVP
ncbi:MAG: glycosyltransferase family 2 protein, partial [Bacteroidetes bacterium]